MECLARVRRSLHNTTTLRVRQGAVVQISCLPISRTNILASMVASSHPTPAALSCTWTRKAHYLRRQLWLVDERPSMPRSAVGTGLVAEFEYADG